MKNKLKGKVAVISGGDSGIGLAISKRLKEHDVKIYDISNNVTDNPIFEKSFEVDITDNLSMKKVVDEILNVEKQIDLLFCNAGIGVGGLIENASVDAIDKIMNVNLNAQIKMTNLFLNKKGVRNGGRIVFTGSLASIVPLPYQACYSASKAGVENFARAISNELKTNKIQVTTIMPGDINTNFTASRIKQTGNDEKEKHGIVKMEKAEKTGKTADFVAKRVIKIIKKRKMPLRVSIGFTSKLIAGLVKIFPIRFINILVRLIYV